MTIITLNRTWGNKTYAYYSTDGVTGVRREKRRGRPTFVKHPFPQRGTATQIRVAKSSPVAIALGA